MLSEMKKIGHEVLFLPTSPENCRNGEGAFIRLKDGGILFAYTEFLKGLGHDSDVSRISGFVSYDEGETWTDKRVLLEPSEGALNVMSVSLLRRVDGSLALIHGEKYEDKNGTITTRKLMKVSYDEGKTWSENIRCYGRDGYSVSNNDRVTRLKSGRLIIPIAHHNDEKGLNPERGLKLNPGILTFSISDDDGKTWHTSDVMMRSPYSDPTGFQEPGVYQHEDGTLWLWCRTLLGSQFMSYSKDDGETWTNPEPSRFFTSPRSPMSVKKLGDHTVAVFNPTICHYTFFSTLRICTAITITL